MSRSTRHAPLLLHNTMRITEGHLDEFRAAVERGVAFVEEYGPQLAVQVFIDDERLLAHSFTRTRRRSWSTGACPTRTSRR